MSFLVRKCPIKLSKIKLQPCQQFLKQQHHRRLCQQRNQGQAPQAQSKPVNPPHGSSAANTQTSTSVSHAAETQTTETPVSTTTAPIQGLVHAVQESAVKPIAGLVSELSGKFKVYYGKNYTAIWRVEEVAATTPTTNVLLVMQILLRQ